MDVEHHFAAIHACVATDISEGWRLVDNHLAAVGVCHLLQVDIVVDPVGEQRDLGGEPLRRVVVTQVELQAGLRAEMAVTHLVAERSLMLAV